MENPLRSLTYHFFVSSLYVKNWIYAFNECVKRERRTLATVSHKIFFLEVFLILVLQCSPVFSWYMHQQSDTLPEGKLPHTALSFNPGPKEISLLLLSALKSQLSSAPFFTPFKEMGTWNELSTGDWRGQSLHFPAL